MSVVALHLLLGQAASFAEAHDKARCEGARTHALLLAATADLGVDSHAWLSAHVEGANTLRSIQFVPTNRQQINLHLVDVDWQLAHTLRSISVEEHTVGAADFANLLQRLNCADLVVDVNDGADEGVGADGLLEDVEVDETLSGHRQVSHFEAFVFELTAGVKDALVVDLGRDDVLLFVAVKACQSLQAQVVRLGGARGEHDLFGGGADEVSDVFARIFTGLLRLPAEGVRARVRVTVALSHERHHFVENSWVDRSGSLIIEVEGAGLHSAIIGLSDLDACRSHAHFDGEGALGCGRGQDSAAALVQACSHRQGHKLVQHVFRFAI
mmetsp:Transcript_24902/g.33362  ORF Transcript_24902/g.33362 Transcript_24902/m.33362 type:complete len:326 (+) Transcript_24902:480-1457(+)